MQALLNVLKAGGTLGIELFGLEASNPPAAPTNPRFESRSDDQLGFAWSSPSGVVAGYDVHYTSAPPAPCCVPDTAPLLNHPIRNNPAVGWVAVSRTGQTASQTISGLIPGTAYRVRVRARNSAGAGDWVVIKGTTSGTPPSVTVFDPAPVGDVLVSNFSQRPYALSSQPNQRAWGQAFTTGSVPTMLSSIDLVASFPAHTKQLQVELWSATSGGFPSAKISDLVVPWGNIAAGETVSFGAPANTRLAANTAYSIVLYRPGNSAAIGFATTNNNNEDPGAATGWSIADGSASYKGHSPSASLNNSLSNSSFVIAVKGRLEPNLVTLSASPNPVQEGSPVTVTATLSYPLSEDASIPLHTAMMPQNSATVGAYDIVIPAGQTTGTHEFTAPQLEDGEMKQYQIAVEWWRMREPRPLDAKGSQSIAGVTVLDENADPPRVSVSDAKGWEQLRYGRLCFEFTLNRAAPHEIWVGYRTEDGTAIAGQDYQGVVGSPVISFAPGETRKSKCISIIDDGVEDSGDTFSMVLVNPHGAILGRARGTGTIYNHEPTSLSALAAEGASGEDGPFAALDIGTFAPATTAYSATVPHGTTHARLTPTSLNGYLTITTGLDGEKKSQVPFGGGTGPAVALAVGENLLVVKTLFNGQRQTYRVTITREERKLSADANLSALTAEGAPGADGDWTALDIGAFSAGTTDYTATVPYETTHARLTATAAHAKAALKTGAASSLSAADSGSAGGAVALDVGANEIEVAVTAEDGTEKTYTVTVTREERELSSNADLSGLTAESGADGDWTALDIGAFSAGTTDYAATVPYETTHARLTATAAHAAATLENGGAVVLDVGANEIEVAVTAEDGTEKTYTVTVSRGERILSSNADLSGLTAESGADGAWAALDIGTFAAATTDYAATVPYETTHARLTATAAHAAATLENGGAVALDVGANGIEVEVTAEDGTEKTYTVTVTRKERILSSNADLSGLTAESGADGDWTALDIGTFSAATTSYAATVPHDTTHVRLTATAAHAAATLENGGAVALDVGANEIEVAVTAEDGTKKTYAVRVERAAPPKPLTVSFGDAPAEHDADAAFALSVRFSEALGEGGAGPSAESFDVRAGKVKEIEDLGGGLWRVWIKPGSWRDVTVTLAGGRDCGSAGAVCAADGRTLENTVEASVGGPVRIRIEGGKAREGKDAAIDFALTLNRPSASAVTVDYATADGTATAGEDYTAASGTLTFAAGETEATLRVAVLDDEVDEGSENFFVHLSNASGAHLRGPHKKASGTIRNTDPMPRAWLSRFGRAAADRTVEAISRRVNEGPRESHLTLGGGGLDRLLALGGGPDDAGDESPDAASAAAEILFAEQNNVDRLRALSLDYVSGNRGGGFAAGAGRIGGGMGGMNFAAGSGGGNFASGAGMGMNDGGLSRGGMGSGFGMGGMHSGGGMGSPSGMSGMEGMGLSRGGMTARDGLPGGGMPHASLPGGAMSHGGGSEGGLDEFARALGVPRLRDLLGNASFFLAPAAGEDGPGWLGSWSAWGETGGSRFGGQEGGLRIDGETTSATMGFDTRRDRWLAGVALSWNEGMGVYAGSESGTGGDVASTLFGLHPYARYEFSDRASVWGALGYGTGSLTLASGGAGEDAATDLGHAMLALGGRSALTAFSGEYGDFELAVRSDARMQRTVSDAVPGLVGTAGATSRVRAVLEGSGALRLPGGGVLLPTLEAGLRHDGGDAETGAGVEVGAGLGYSSGRFTVEITARGLVAHEDAAYEEWGFGGTVAFTPRADGRGLRLQLGSTWGAAHSGVNALWQRETAAGLAQQGAGAFAQAGQRYQAEIGYGLEGRLGGGLWQPFVAVDAAGRGEKAWRSGFRYTAGERAELGLEIQRRPDFGAGEGRAGLDLMLTGQIRF